MLYLFLLFFTELLLFYLSYKLCHSDLIAPPVVMSGMFIIATIFAIMNGKSWEIEYSPIAYLLIVSGICVFLIATVIMQSARVDKNIVFTACSKRNLYIENWKQVLVALFSVLFLVIYYKEVSRIASMTGSGSGNLLWYFRQATSVEATVAINPIVNVLGKILDVTSYIFMFTFINNVFVYKAKIKNNFLLLFPVASFICKSLLSSNRQEILKIVSFSIVTSYILYHQKIGWKKNLSLKYIKIGVIALAIGLPLFYYASYIIGRGSTRTMFESISTYVGGPIQHFNQYIQNPPPPSDYIGSECFPGVLNLLGRLGLIEYHSAVHLEMRQLGITQGNVYTFFRRPIQDFGVLGMYVFTFIVGAIFSKAYYFAIKYRSVSFKTDRNIILYAYFFYWIILSATDQYSMGLVSISTVFNVMLFYVLTFVYYKLNVKKGRVIIKSCKFENTKIS